MLAIDETGMALLSALVEALPHPVYVQEIGSGAFLYGNGRFRDIFDISPPPVVNGEFHDAENDRWYVLHSHPLCWIDRRKAALCVLTDVTEERRASELIAKHRDAAHRTARLIALGEFASAVAHELNQPLAAIATYNHSCMRMLQSGNPDPEQLLQAMHICRDQAKRAGRIIQRLRGLLRHPGPALAEQDLNELVAAVLELAEPGAREAGVSFERALSEQPPVVRADRLLIEQAALNLVRNAVEAVQELAPERRRVTVATCVEADGSGTLAVSDLGDGVLPEVRERLFEAFVTTKRGGLGLGLSICRSVVEAHGGAIQHEENPHGARFAFTLPR
ncbi:MAG TPA: ATP-binding protein [Burkholderiales bacterium]|nr:ATP-binding protein [Burkholderiales bacterium]